MFLMSFKGTAVQTVVWKMSAYGFGLVEGWCMEMQM